MPLKLPIQSVIDPTVGYPVYTPIQTPNPEENAILLDEVGGNYGSLPGDPPPLRCDPRSSTCAMPTPVPAPSPFAMPAPVALASLFGI